MQLATGIGIPIAAINGRATLIAQRRRSLTLLCLRVLARESRFPLLSGVLGGPSAGASEMAFKFVKRVTGARASADQSAEKATTRERPRGTSAQKEGQE